MSILNNKSIYGLLSKLFHWLTAAGLLVQIPLGFYLVDLDFDQFRVDIENYHILFGLILFYTTLIRLTFNYYLLHQISMTMLFQVKKF